MSGPQEFLGGRVVLHAGDCLDVLRALPDASIDAVVTDPPYALVSIARRFGKPGAKHSANPARAAESTTGAYQRASAGFMGKTWDTGERAFAVEFWAEVLRVLKPGGHVAAFAGTRTYHRLTCAIEDAGFEIRDQLAWVYGSGFPKSHDVSKAIDKAAGAEREVIARRKYRDIRNGHGRGVGDGINAAARTGGPTYLDHAITAPATEAAARWQGWGTALKPAWEPICLARKPLGVWGAGGTMKPATVAGNVLAHGTGAINLDGCRVGDDVWHHPGSNAVGGIYGDFANDSARSGIGRHPANILHDGSPEGEQWRYFYSAKADAEDRAGSKHPTVKPVDLMQWLCRLITPPAKAGPDGVLIYPVILDPFAGTGTTGEAAWREGFSAVLIEREEEYRADIARRMALATAGPATRRAESARARHGEPDPGPLFGGHGLAGGGAEDLRALRRSGRAIGPIGLKR